MKIQKKLLNGLGIWNLGGQGSQTALLSHDGFLQRNSATFWLVRHLVNRGQLLHHIMSASHPLRTIRNRPTADAVAVPWLDQQAVPCHIECEAIGEQQMRAARAVLTFAIVLFSPAQVLAQEAFYLQCTANDGEARETWPRPIFRVTSGGIDRWSSDFADWVDDVFCPPLQDTVGLGRAHREATTCTSTVTNNRISAESIRRLPGLTQFQTYAIDRRSGEYLYEYRTGSNTGAASASERGTCEPTTNPEAALPPRRF